MSDMSAEAAMKMQRHIYIVLIAVAIFSMGSAPCALAVPETTAVRITDATTSSFSVVWMTDVAADPMVEVYSDNAMVVQITDKLIITPMPAVGADIVQAARAKGIMKVRVAGLSPSTTYYVRTVTKDPANVTLVSYSPLYSVITAAKVSPYRSINNTVEVSSNDLTAFRVYIRPSELGQNGLGDLMLLEYEGSSYPLSAFAGHGIGLPEGVIDLNNLFGADRMSLPLTGGERITLRIYRGKGVSTLIHYRWLPLNSGAASVVVPERGFFADVNLDGSIDDADFQELKKQYRTSSDDALYNPDFNFVEDPDGKVDVRSFSKFSKEYGRTNVR